MTENLKRCPFCGGKANIAKGQIEFWAYCPHCGAQTELYETKQEVEKAWNSRPIENELAEKIGKLEVENKRLREALEFYAELDGNGIQLYGDMDSKALEFVDGDSQIFGTIAKDALKGNEK